MISFTETRFNILKFAAMKKLILLLGIMSLGFQCGPEPPDPNGGAWRIKNSTNQTLTITIPPYSVIQSYPLDNNISPGDAIPLGFTSTDIEKIPNFELIRRFWHGLAEEDIYFEVLSSNGTTLVKWDYLNKDLPGKQFFKEGSWQRKQSSKGDNIDVTWFFEILPEDIQ